VGETGQQAEESLARSASVGVKSVAALLNWTSFVIEFVSVTLATVAAYHAGLQNPNHVVEFEVALKR
jgi:hypothetical protein